MVKLLSGLSDGETVQIPGFYSKVRSISSAERQTYEAIVALQIEESQSQSSSSSLLQSTSVSRSKRVPTVDALMGRWRHPSLTIHGINISGGSGNSTVIPSIVDASVSIRIVPDQSLESITESLKEDIHRRFDALNSSNRVEVSIRRSPSAFQAAVADFHLDSFFLSR